jgi:hypothetical protein
MILCLATIAVLAIVLPSASLAQDGTITVDLSYKVVLNPADGTRPPGATDAAIDQAIAGMNTLYQAYSRGYSFRRVGPITQVGGQGDTTGPSRWYNTNFFASDGSTQRTQMEAAARADARYAWNNNAINIYLVNGICGGLCSFPTADNIILIGGCSAGTAWVQLHEIGHYFNLCHTQGCPCGCCTAGQTGACNTVPGDDGIADTLPDLPCWSQDQIARNSFSGRVYAQLNPGEQSQVDNVFHNLMSYHGGACGNGGSQTRLTELQLDRWADANPNRLNVTLGRRTRFVQVGGTGSGTSTAPFGRVQNAVTASTRDDIILLRPGSYNEILTINRAVTLRVTRRGPVVIGTSRPPSLGSTPSQEEIDAALAKWPGIAGQGTGERLEFPGADRE